MEKYENGKVYKLYNKVNDKFYIGSTYEVDLNHRKSKYKADSIRKPNSKLSQEILSIGWKDGDGRSNWFMEVVEYYPCKCKGDLEKREIYWQREFLESHPEQLLNQNLTNIKPEELEVQDVYGKINKYNKGKIYKLYNKVNDKFSIGSTIDGLNHRKSKYKADLIRKPNSNLSQEILSIGWNDGDENCNWFTELIESFPCKSKGELEKRECYWKRIFLESHSEQLLNQQTTTHKPLLESHSEELLNNHLTTIKHDEVTTHKPVLESHPEQLINQQTTNNKPEEVNKYDNGKVYKLYNKINDKFYIGSTNDGLDHRKSKYNSDAIRKPTSKLSQEILSIGWNDEKGRCNWIIELIESCPCKSKCELEKKEGYWQREFFKSHPDDILNSRLEGNEDGEPQIRASKKYRETHVEKIKVEQVAYRNENKEILNERKREIIECDICESKVCRNSMSDHKKSIKCQNAAFSKGIIKKVKVIMCKKSNLDADEHKEYDKQRYLKKKEEGYYEDRKSGPRVYQTCEWVLQRATKDGKKAGDMCESPCITKDDVTYCAMHKRCWLKNKGL